MPILSRASSMTALAALALLTACSGGSSAEHAEPSPTPTSASPSLELVVEEWDEQDASEIRRDGQSAMADARSVRVRGSGLEAGSPVVIDLKLDQQGTCAGTVEIQGYHLEIRRLADTDQTWIRANDGFWRDTVPAAQAEAVVTAMHGRWLLSPEENAAPFVVFCDLDHLLDVFVGGLSDLERYETTGRETVAGQETVVVEATAAAGGDLRNRVFVQAGGEHHILRVDNVVEGRTETMLLSDIGKPVRVTPPPAGQTVDLTD